MSYDCRLRTSPTPASAGVTIGGDRRHYHPLDICTESYFTTTVASAHTLTQGHTQIQTTAQTHSATSSSSTTSAQSSPQSSPRASSVWCHFTLVQPTKRGKFLSARDKQYWYSALSLIVLRVPSASITSTADDNGGKEDGVNVMSRPKPRLNHRGMEVADSCAITYLNLTLLFLFSSHVSHPTHSYFPISSLTLTIPFCNQVVAASFMGAQGRTCSPTVELVLPPGR